MASTIESADSEAHIIICLLDLDNIEKNMRGNTSYLTLFFCTGLDMML